METNRTASTPSPGEVSSPSPTKERSLAARVAERIDPQAIVEGARRLPELLFRETAEHPYRALGVAAGIGFGLGTVFGSRIARVALLTAGGYVLNEVARSRVERLLEDPTE
jgi:hypothetical protein